MKEILSSFASLGLSNRLQKALKEKGFEEPTEIQKKCIPLLLNENREVIGQAETGTGKTAAFALPILETLKENEKEVKALILTPTRELALQVAEEINSLKGESKIDAFPIYGGSSMENQLRKLKKGVEIVVGTPGRILDHIRRGSLDLSNLEFLVLDEADEMLDMGFIDDISAILEASPEKKRMLLFSATMPKEILKLAEKFMKDPTVVRTQTEDKATSQTDQIYYEVRESDKLEALTRIIDKDPDFYGVVFCRTKTQCDEVAKKLVQRGYEASAIHGDLSQRERESILERLKAKKLRILVATDVASRGLDIKELTHVINYSLPQDPEIYIHRVGRTGRAGKTGTAITFITPQEARKFSLIKKASKNEIRKESVPSPSEVVASKRERIKGELLEALDIKPSSYFLDLAKEITEGESPISSLASLLSYIYKSELDPNQYREIEEIKTKQEKRSARDRKAERDKNRPYDKQKEASLDEKGATRVFIRKGKKDGLTKRDLESIIINQTGAKSSEINNIEVGDDFSFVTLPYDIGEKTLKFFNKRSTKPSSINQNKREKSESRSKKSNAIYSEKRKDENKEDKSFLIEELRKEEDYYYKKKRAHSSSKTKSKQASKNKKGKRKR